MGDKDLSMTARKFITKHVLKYTKENWVALNAENGNVDKNILRDIKKDPAIMDWMIDEVLARGAWEKLGITLQYEWVKEGSADLHVAIFKIKNRYVRSFTTFGRNEIASFEFVKPRKKKITITEYEVVK